jgi:hypothetical protein
MTRNSPQIDALRTDALRLLALALLLLGGSLGGARQAHAENVDGPFGVYPDCIAPAVPLETHSWWHEDGEEAARHIHIGACLPNARDMTGDLVSIDRPQDFTVRVMAFNHPGKFSWVRWSWESDIKEKIPQTLQCQTRPDERKQCMRLVKMTLDPNKSGRGGLRELRLSPIINHKDLGTRQLASLNFQIYLKNGKGEDNYRSRIDPIARSWYPDFDYAKVRINYMDLFNGEEDLDKSIPTVSGVVPIKVRHSGGEQETRSLLFENVNFHHTPDFHTEAVVGVPQHGGGVLLYDKPGKFEGTYHWDTRDLPNGVNVLYFQTTDSNDSGFNAGAMKYLFNVQNGPSQDLPQDQDQDQHQDQDQDEPQDQDQDQDEPQDQDQDQEIFDALEDVNSMSAAALEDDSVDPVEALDRILERVQEALGL